MNDLSGANAGMIVLVCGSAAIDFIGEYDGSFHEYQEKFPTAGLNISLQLKTLRSSFGGCGINITYGLNLLGISAIPLAAVGADFLDHYEPYLKKLGIDTRHICVDDNFTDSAHCIIYSDREGNQITAFNPGAAISPKRPLPSETGLIDHIGLAMLAPEEAPTMLRQARDLAEREIPMIFDPGQVLAEFSSAELREMLMLCGSIMCNAHEWEIMQTNSGLGAQAICKSHEVLVTHGADGVDIYRNSGGAERVAAVTCAEVVDATGSGDAFRAGFLFGRVNQLHDRACAELGCVMASINIGVQATQSYQVSREELLDLHHLNYGYRLVVR